MKVLMLGNSFTYYHDMPEILSVLLNADVSSITKGGAHLREQLDVSSETGSQLAQALMEKWDYVILQEQSSTPFVYREEFEESISGLCQLIRQNGAEPLLYATWAYREGSEKLAATGLTYDEMAEKLHESYHAAAEMNKALIADVGTSFTQVRSIVDLYEADDFHPSAAGSVLAASILAQTILAHRK